MTKAEAIAMLKRIQEPEAWEPQINQAAFEALDMAIEALSQESSEDVISRQAAIDILKSMAVPRYLDSECEDIYERDRTLDKAIDAMCSLPSAQPQLPEWAKKVEEYRQSAPQHIHNPLAWALYQVWKEIAMKIERMTEIEASDIEVGDRIHVGHYTATCQEITPKRALFLLDQYLDDTYEINASDTNVGGYAKSDLRETLKNKEILDIFKCIRDYMAPFENGDLIRIPFAGELFGNKLPKWCEPDGHKQWPLMQNVRNQLALRRGKHECGWLQNKGKTYFASMDFCYVDSDGDIYSHGASYFYGVRPVFQIAKWKDKEPALRDFDYHNQVVSPDRAYVLKNSGICYEYHH